MKHLLLGLVLTAIATAGCKDTPKPDAPPPPGDEAVNSSPPPEQSPPGAPERDFPSPLRTATPSAATGPTPTRPATVSPPSEEWTKEIAAPPSDDWIKKEDVGTIEIIKEEDPIKQRYEEALELLEIDKTEQAILLLQENVTDAPDDAINHWNLASVHLALEQGEAALPPLRKTVELDPDNTEYVLTLAGVELLLGNADAAEALLTKLVKSHPEIADVHYQLGLLHLAAGRAEAAVAAMQETTRLEPKHPEAWTRLAILHVEAQRWPDALAAVEAVKLAGDPDAAEAVEFLHGQVVGKLGRCEDAAKMLVKAREVGQEDLADLAEGECWLVKNEPDKALPLLLAVTQRTPDCQPCQMFLGDVLFIKADWGAAADAYGAAAAASPEDWRSRRQAGKCFMNLQRPADAVPMLEAAVKLAAEDADAWELLGRAYVATGNRAETWTVMERLEKLGEADRAKAVRQLLTQ